MNEVKVYGKPGCVQCKYTVKELDKQEIPSSYIDIEQDPEAKKLVLDSGNMQLPMVVSGEDRWHGLRIDRIREIASPAKQLMNQSKNG